MFVELLRSSLYDEPPGKFRGASTHRFLVVRLAGQLEHRKCRMQVKTSFYKRLPVKLSNLKISTCFEIILLYNISTSTHRFLVVRLAGQREQRKCRMQLKTSFYKRLIVKLSNAKTSTYLKSFQCAINAYMVLIYVYVINKKRNS